MLSIMFENKRLGFPVLLVLLVIMILMLLNFSELKTLVGKDVAIYLVGVVELLAASWVWITIKIENKCQ